MKTLYVATHTSNSNLTDSLGLVNTQIETGLPSPHEELFPAIALDAQQLSPPLIQTLRRDFPGAVVAALSESLTLEQADQLVQLNPLCALNPQQPNLNSWQRFVDRKAALDKWQTRHKSLVELCAQLTPKEREVFLQSCTFDAAPELAESLELSVRTVEAHRYNIVRKVNQGSFREWTVLLRQAMQQLASLGVNGELLLRGVQRARRARLLKTA